MLVELLDKYVEASNQESPLAATLLVEVRRRLPGVSDPKEFHAIASNIWDRYFCVDVNLMIEILRRWVEIDPEEAQHVLGSYLLAHGPDWDDEGHRLCDKTH